MTFRPQHMLDKIQVTVQNVVHGLDHVTSPLLALRLNVNILSHGFRSGPECTGWAEKNVVFFVVQQRKNKSAIQVLLSVPNGRWESCLAYNTELATFTSQPLLVYLKQVKQEC